MIPTKELFDARPTGAAPSGYDSTAELLAGVEAALSKLGQAAVKAEGGGHH